MGSQMNMEVNSRSQHDDSKQGSDDDELAKEIHVVEPVIATPSRAQRCPVMLLDI
jgi:hypothetical protein